MFKDEKGLNSHIFKSWRTKSNNLKVQWPKPSLIESIGTKNTFFPRKLKLRIYQYVECKKRQLSLCLSLYSDYTLNDLCIGFKIEKRNLISVFTCVQCQEDYNNTELQDHVKFHSCLPQLLLMHVHHILYQCLYPFVSSTQHNITQSCLLLFN